MPQALNDLILLSVNRDPNSRFQTAEAFRNALGSVMGAVAAPTIPVPPPAAPAVSQEPPPARKSNRAIWATIGALCCVGILVAAIQFGPWKKAAADSPSATQQPHPAQTEQPAPAPPPAAPAEPAPVAQTPQVTAPPAAPPESPRVSAVPKPVRPTVKPPAGNVAPTPPAAVPAAPAAPQAPPQSAAVPPPSQPDLAVQRAEMQKVRESLSMLSARSISIHSTLQNLQRSQAASGLGLRGDWLQSATMMDSFLRGANDALAAGDAATARDLMEKGERQVEKLEKALNK
jgi:serine/threonine-protein kinase